MLTRNGAVRVRKKAANLSVAIREKQREQWLSKNRAAIEAYNEHVEKDGVFSDGLRAF